MRKSRGSLTEIGHEFIEVLGAGHEGMVVLADSSEEAHELQRKLQADYDAAPKGSKRGETR